MSKLSHRPGGTETSLELIAQSKTQALGRVIENQQRTNQAEGEVQSGHEESVEVGLLSWTERKGGTSSLAKMGWGETGAA